MSRVLSDTGVFSAETNSDDSIFIIHASYGYGPERKRLEELRLNERFIVGGRIYTAVMLTTNRVDGRNEQTGTVQEFSPVLEVEIPNTEVHVDHPIGSYWRGAHPHFMMDDIDDLIALLTRLRDKEDQ